MPARANCHNVNERNFLKPPHPWTFGPRLPHAVLIGGLVGPEGFEPPTPDPKSGVLPLHHRPIKGRDVSLILFPCRVCLLRSGARYGGSLRCCLGDNLFTGDRAYIVWKPDSNPTSLGYWCQPTGRRNEILYGVIRGHSLTPQRSSGQSRGNTAVGKETTLAENLTLRCLA